MKEAHIKVGLLLLLSEIDADADMGGLRAYAQAVEALGNDYLVASDNV